MAFAEVERIMSTYVYEMSPSQINLSSDARDAVIAVLVVCPLTVFRRSTEKRLPADLGKTHYSAIKARFQFGQNKQTPPMSTVQLQATAIPQQNRH